MKEATKENLKLLSLMAVWGFLNVAWVFWPDLGKWWGLIMNGAVVVIIIIALIRSRN